MKIAHPFPLAPQTQTDLQRIAQVIERRAGERDGFPKGWDTWISPGHVAAATGLPAVRVGQLAHRHLDDLRRLLPELAIDYERGRPGSFEVRPLADRESLTRWRLDHPRSSAALRAYYRECAMNEQLPSAPEGR